MMFFFIAGVQPKTVDIEGHPRLCPSCGLQTARMKRVDHYLSVFFLPLFRVKKGVPVLVCRNCGIVSDDAGSVRPGGFEMKRGEPFCPYCGADLDRSFRFCPFCGRSLSGGA